MTKSFADVKDDLAPDGALREFCILGISQAEWDRFIAVAPKLAERSVFQCGGQELPLPSRFPDISAMQKQNPTTLHMWVSGAEINCHFFVETEIELDFCPSDFQDEEKWDGLVAFLQAVVDAIGKKGIITHGGDEKERAMFDEIIPRSRE